MTTWAFHVCLIVSLAPFNAADLQTSLSIDDQGRLIVAEATDLEVANISVLDLWQTVMALNQTLLQVQNELAARDALIANFITSLNRTEQYLMEIEKERVCQQALPCSLEYESMMCSSDWPVACLPYGGNASNWTLAARFNPNDSIATWSYANRYVWANDQLVHPSSPNGTGDYKGQAFLKPGNDLLFRSSTGDELQYNNVLNDQSIQQLMLMHEPCGSLNIKLCSSVPPLYVHPNDLDGVRGGVGVLDTFGFAWSHNNNNGCPLDDPGAHSSLGGSATYNRAAEFSMIGVWAATPLYTELFVR